MVERNTFVLTIFIIIHIVQHKNVTVAQVLNLAPLNIGIRRILSDNKWNLWIHLYQIPMMIQLSDDHDKFVWNLTSSQVFSVKLMYEDLMNDHTIFLQKYV